MSKPSKMNSETSGTFNIGDKVFYKQFKRAKEYVPAIVVNIYDHGLYIKFLTAQVIDGLNKHHNIYVAYPQVKLVNNIARLLYF